MSTSTIVVRELLIYPIKSCAGVQVNEARTTRYGLSSLTDPLLSDRRWMVIHNARQRDQRQSPRMALIRPSFTAAGLRVEAPGMEPLLIPYSPLPDEIIDIEEMNVKGRKFGEEVSRWLSTFLEKPDMHLVYFDDEFAPQLVKNIEPEFPNGALPTDVAAYHDMAAFHLGSLESIGDLNTRLPKPISIHNFRPNIIVSGVDAPYGEDFWREIQIGDQVKLRWIRSCLRCLLPTVDQETGIRDPTQEPWKTLQTYRRKPELYATKAQFGIYLLSKDDGIIRVGDRVHVLTEDKNF